MYEEIVTESGTVTRRTAFDIRVGDTIFDGRATVVRAIYSDPACNSVGIVAMTIVRPGKPGSITVQVEADRPI